MFDGRQNVAFTGKHVDRVDADEVRSLAKKFVAADFYSMDSSYDVLMTDQPLYVLSIVIDGQTKKVQDYRGARAGMPAVVTEMEEEVDKLARTERWIKGRPMQK